MTTIRDTLKIITDSAPFQWVCTIGVIFLLLTAGFTLLSFGNPTQTHSEIITVSERQILGGILTRNYYVVTPDNIWYECAEWNDTYIRMQPGHRYQVQIRTAAPRTWWYLFNQSKDEQKLSEELDAGTNIYNYPMIVGVDSEVL
jgi:hypothetical protein